MYQPFDEENDRVSRTENDFTLLDISQNMLQISVPTSSLPGINFSIGTETDVAENHNLQLTDIIDDDLPDFECLGDPEFIRFLDSFKKSPLQNGPSESTIETDQNQSEENDQPIKNEMTVEIQPPTNIRYRYESDGKRQIENSRSKPMTLKLPNLTDYSINTSDDVWIQLCLITTDQNPSGIEFIHTHKLEYHDNDALTADDGSVLVPLKPEDIQKKTKQLARISIIKKKLEQYDFKLQPYQTSSTESSCVQTYKTVQTKSTVANAKRFRDIYHLELSRIVCHILIRKDDGWYLTDKMCKTNIMEEKLPIASNKRSAPVPIEDEEDEITKKARLNY